jgi:amino acid transporter/nucleotide-binding universal stress UspA family protein
MPQAEGPNNPSGSANVARAVKVIIVSSVMFTFISYWRTAAVVLCDLASTAYYIGGIVESAIGPAAPWFILAVMLFSYAVRSVYIESCSLFVRGGVYRVVKEAMGGFLAKLSVSALMFDYILTGPTSGVSAGRYVMALIARFLEINFPATWVSLGFSDTATSDLIIRWGSVLIACSITLYFFRQNLLGIHESSDKALKIMFATTVMAVVMLTWCGITLAVRGPVNRIPWTPDLRPKVELVETDEPDPDTGNLRKVWVKDPDTGKLAIKLDKNGAPIPKMSDSLEKVGIEAQDDPLGFLGRILPKDKAENLRHPPKWLSLIGVLGLFIAFGHSILAMSGEETLAQVYREVESPKLPNFKKAAFIVFVYSVVLTASISFLAVALIPDDVRMKLFSENLIGGLARYVLGPASVKWFLEAFVVVVGFLILAGAVNTAMIGSNGVLNRVAEDGVLPDWFLHPHPRYGTTNRVLWLITIMQLATILLSQGDMILLGEAYAFGVVWSFVFKALAMVVLRFKDRSPREFKVPLNIRWGNVEIPIGLGLIFLVLLTAALLNFMTKEVATVGGLAFTSIFLATFMISEHLHEKRLRGRHHEHLDQFNKETAETVSPANLGLTKPYRKLVAIRSRQNLFMLEKTLQETDPETTNVVVMTAKVSPPGDTKMGQPELDNYDQQLMTAVVERAEKAGKQVKPLIVPTNNPLYAIVRTAKDLNAQEMVVGASNVYNADEQLEQMAFYWVNLFDGQPAPLTIRILGHERDVQFDVAGGSRIPKIGERKARSVSELRAAGVGVDRVLLIHDDTPESSDLFQAVLTMLDPNVALGVVPLRGNGANGAGNLALDMQRAGQLGREVEVHPRKDSTTVNEIVRLVRETKYDLLIMGKPAKEQAQGELALEIDQLLGNAPCRVFLSVPPSIPLEPEN